MMIYMHSAVMQVTRPSLRPCWPDLSTEHHDLRASRHAQEAGYTDEANSNIRKITAKRLLESKTTIPHYYLTLECQVDRLLAMRQQLNERLSKEGVKISVNDFLVKASALVTLPASTPWPALVVAESQIAELGGVASSTAPSLSG